MNGPDFEMQAIDALAKAPGDPDPFGDAKAEIARLLRAAYEQGYRDGESSGHADYAAALEEALPASVDPWNPRDVAAAIRKQGATPARTTTDTAHVHRGRRADGTEEQA